MGDLLFTESEMAALQADIKAADEKTEFYKESLKTAVTRLEQLYRIIYGHVELNEPMDKSTVYFAERFMIDTLKLLRDENGFTGRPCHVCKEYGADNPGFRSCAACDGTGIQKISADA